MAALSGPRVCSSQVVPGRRRGGGEGRAAGTRSSPAAVLRASLRVHRGAGDKTQHREPGWGVSTVAQGGPGKAAAGVSTASSGPQGAGGGGHQAPRCPSVVVVAGGGGVGRTPGTLCPGRWAGRWAGSEPQGRCCRVGPPAPPLWAWALDTDGVAQVWAGRLAPARETWIALGVSLK